MAETLKEKTVAAFFWVILDKAGGGVVNSLITIALARLLSPGDFGLVAMVMVFFEISSVFVGSGFYVALIRERNLSAEDKSTTFIFNLVTAAILYAALFFAAPAIAAFFSQPVLIWVVRIMGVNLIISSFDLIQRAQLTQRIDFQNADQSQAPGRARFGYCRYCHGFVRMGGLEPGGEIRPAISNQYCSLVGCQPMAALLAI